jgi:hypothetical protein
MAEFYWPSLLFTNNRNQTKEKKYEQATLIIMQRNKRPEPPIQVAKFALEGGITLRQLIPIFQHWKSTRRKRMNLQYETILAKLL